MVQESSYSLLTFCVYAKISAPYQYFDNFFPSHTRKGIVFSVEYHLKGKILKVVSKI